ncbi:HAMP domain-containing protein [Sphingomonas sp. MMS24-JH45]
MAPATASPRGVRRARRRRAGPAASRSPPHPCAVVDLLRLPRRLLLLNSFAGRGILDQRGRAGRRARRGWSGGGAGRAVPAPGAARAALPAGGVDTGTGCGCDRQHVRPDALASASRTPASSTPPPTAGDSGRPAGSTRSSTPSSARAAARRCIATGPTHGAGPTLPRSIVGRPRRDRLARAGSHPGRHRGGGAEQRVLSTVNARDVTERVRVERFRLSVVIIVVAAISLALSLFLARTIVNPLRRLARAAVRVRLGRAREVVVPRLPEQRRRDRNAGARAVGHHSSPCGHGSTRPRRSPPT